jgi:hypothetical protein
MEPHKKRCKHCRQSDGTSDAKKQREESNVSTKQKHRKNKARSKQKGRGAEKDKEKGDNRGGRVCEARLSGSAVKTQALHPQFSLRDI